MKKLICALSFLLLIMQVGNAQWINGLIVNPANPTTLDDVRVIVQGEFPSAGCNQWYIQSQNNTGYKYTYNILNCLGMMSMICDYNDTIQMGQLPAGYYTVIVNLNAGGYGLPCNPAYQWKTDSVHFTVTLISSVTESEDPQDLCIYPNPAAGGQFTVSIPQSFDRRQPLSLDINDVNGRLVKRMAWDLAVSRIRVETDLAPGFYFIRLNGAAQPLPPHRLVICK